MDYPLNIDSNERLYNLLKDFQNLFYRQRLIFLLEVGEKIALLTEFHHNFEFLIMIIVRLEDSDKIGMVEFIHNLDLFEGFINFEGI